MWFPFQDESIRRIQAQLLVHVIKNTDGGWKLSSDMITILALAFEDCYLAGAKRTDAKAVAELTGCDLELARQVILEMRQK